MEFFKKRAARKAAKEQVKEAIRQADERVAKKRAEKIDEALEQAVEKQDAEKEALEKLSADHVSQDETIIALREALADDADKRIHITAQTAVAAVFSVLKDEKGIRIEDALAVIGAFAGHMAIRAAMNAGASGDEERLTVIAAANDESAFYGPAITDFLISLQPSLFNLVAGGVQNAGGTNMPDPNLLLQRHIRTIGTEGFGIPIIPDGNQLRATPRNFLVQLWPLLEPHITVFEKSPAGLCAAMGVAAQDLIVQGKDAVNPDVAAEIVMQSAFATSSIPPATAQKAMDAAMEARAKFAEELKKHAALEPGNESA